MSLLPHQQRVFDEHTELTGRLAKLNDFLNSEKSNAVDVKELGRLRRQAIIMSLYAECLQERMENFSTTQS